MKIVWSPEARLDLLAIYSYIAEDSPNHAEQFATRLRTLVERLAGFPNIGRPGVKAGTRELVIRPYVVRYRVTETEVQVLTVRHGARGLDM